MWSAKVWGSSTNVVSISFDGNDCFMVVFSEDSLGNVIGKNSFGWVWGGKFPARGGTGTKVIWAALSSGEFYRTNRSARTVRWGFEHESSRLFDHRVEKWIDGGSLPHTIIWTPASASMLPPRSTGGIMEKLGFGNPSTESLEGRYEVLSTTNFNGVALPLSFRFEWFAAKKGKRYLMRSIEGTVSQYHPLKDFFRRPPIEVRCVVDDFRLSGVQNFSDWSHYEVTNRWYETNEPIVLANYGQALRVKAGTRFVRRRLHTQRAMVVIVPWPHYAELVITDRIGVRFTFPEGRNNTTPCEIVAQWAGEDVLAAARVFREWRRTSGQIGGLPRARSLQSKAADLPVVTKLYEAAHFYLWGPASFSRHDVEPRKWLPLARALRDAPANSLRGRMRSLFSGEERKALNELAGAQWPMKYLTLTVASGLERVLQSPALLPLPENAGAVEVTVRNRRAVAEELKEFVNPPETWGDGLSLSLLEAMHDAGIRKGLLLLSDLYGRTTRPDAVARAGELGYVLGPYDSYHSVHSPDAHPDQTWETAQFDSEAYLRGRVVKATGLRQGGFKDRGFHFSPMAAWPYVQSRVNRILKNNPYSAWFVDCDATAECFDDFNPLHLATRVDDMNARRQRLRWLETYHNLLVGSEGGSVLFADVIHFGHGVQTPYIGHLEPSFRDKVSPHFLGRHWPPDTPEQSFKPVPVPLALRSPWFDPSVRIPFYRAALGDELIASHHWSFDSLKFSDVATTRALMEILYMTPPMYHLNRETWPIRKERILRHLKFWSPLHRELADKSLKGFEWLTKDRMIQRAPTFIRRPRWQ